MKLIAEASNKNFSYNDYLDGVILPLDNYAVESFCFYTIDEITDIKLNSSNEIFVKINKNIFNDEIDELENILIKLNDIKIDGVFFYDLSILKIVKDLKLDIPLIWSQTHMVNNYVTCDYYYNKGCKYALLSKEITLDEICEIINKSSITCMVEVVSLPSVGFSRRKLISNYVKNSDYYDTKSLHVKEKVSNTFYNVYENDNGTCFYLDKITNGTSIIKKLYDNGCSYIIFREYGIDCFDELVKDTKDYINGCCTDNKYIDKYKKLGDSTNFFFKKTIYKVK